MNTIVRLPIEDAKAIDAPPVAPKESSQPEKRAKAPKASNRQSFPPPSADPLVVLGRQIADLRREYNQIDNRGATKEEYVLETYRQAAMRDLSDRIDLAQEYGSTLRPTSPEGALVQVGLLYELCTSICEREPDVKESEYGAIKRLTFSIAMKFCEVHNVSPDSIGLPALMHENMNPHVDYRERVEAIIREDGL